MSDTKITHTVKVPDMTCQHCKMTITKALDQMPEVKLLSIDLNSKEVAFESAKDKSSVVKSIADAGFHPEG